MPRVPGRIHPRHHGEERVVIDLAGEPEHRRTVAEPDASRLARIEVAARFVHALANGTWFRLDIGSSEIRCPER